METQQITLALFWPEVVMSSLWLATHEMKTKTWTGDPAALLTSLFELLPSVILWPHSCTGYSLFTYSLLFWQRARGWGVGVPSLVAQMVKSLPAVWETWVQSWIRRSPGEGNGNPLQDNSSTQEATGQPLRPEWCLSDASTQVHLSAFFLDSCSKPNDCKLHKMALCLYFTFWN